MTQNICNQNFLTENLLNCETRHKQAYNLSNNEISLCLLGEWHKVHALLENIFYRIFVRHVSSPSSFEKNKYSVSIMQYFPVISLSKCDFPSFFNFLAKDEDETHCFTYCSLAQAPEKMFLHTYSLAPTQEGVQVGGE